VQAARESARRAHCQSNLREWGVALALHEQIYGTFPAGYRLTSPKGTFVARLLPLIEQQTLNYNTEKDWDDPINRPAAQARLALLNCPSTPTRSRVDLTLPGFFPAAGDYVSTHGVNSKYCLLVGWPPFTPPDENGILGQVPCRAVDVTNGT
jgi:hypothetical protein